MKKIIALLICTFAILSLCLAVSAEGVEISRNAEYSLLTAASESHPDDGKKLTDGIFGTHPEGYDGFYASDAYVGFNSDKVNEDGNFVIILDLGKKYDNISGVTVGYLSEITAGISAPESIAIALSDDRNDGYNQIGVIDTVPENIDTAETFAKTLEMTNGTGRYVRVTVTPMSYTDKEGETSISPWTFVDEIAVHVASAPNEESSDLENTSSTENSDDSSVETSETSETSDLSDTSDISGGLETSDVSEISDISDVSDESNTSDISDVSDKTEPTEDELDKTPQTGDNLEIFAFVLLAIASLTMTIALFSTKKSNQF